MRSCEFIRWITERGWVKEREGKGSHTVFRFPKNNAFYVVPTVFVDSGRRILNMKSSIKRLERHP